MVREPDGVKLVRARRPRGGGASANGVVAFPGTGRIILVARGLYTHFVSRRKRMKNVTTYLNFDGKTGEAMQFYAKCLSAKLEIQTFKDARMAAPNTDPNRVIHARLSTKKNGTLLMASDTMPGQPFSQGNNFHVSLDCDTPAELEKHFTLLGQGGRVTMPVQDTFWGAKFGMLIDRYGVGWMFNCEMPKKKTAAPKKNAAKKRR
jgi:PhnB protein